MVSEYKHMMVCYVQNIHVTSIEAASARSFLVLKCYFDRARTIRPKIYEYE